MSQLMRFALRIHNLNWLLILAICAERLPLGGRCADLLINKQTKFDGPGLIAKARG